MARAKISSSKFRRESSLPGLKLLIIFLVISFVLMTVYSREGDQGLLHRSKGFASTITAPISKGGAYIFRPISGLGNVYRNATADQATLTQLQEQNAQLRATVEKLEEYQQESKRLQGLINLKSTYDLSSTGARVIGKSSDAWTRTIEIDKGTADGIGVNMPVMNSYGLIRQVVNAGLNSATVRLLVDEQSGVSAMIQSTRQTGILKGAPDGSLTLDFIPVDATVAKGDVVVTSGFGGVFPKGLPIGEITNVSKDPTSMYYSITVKPPKVSSSLEEVLIITQINKPENQPMPEVKTESRKEEGANLRGTSSQGQAQGSQSESSAAKLGANTASAGEQAIQSHGGEQ